MELVNCPLCSADSYTEVLRGRDELFGLPGEFRAVCCNCCGLVFTNPRPTPESIQHYYPPEYTPHQHHNSPPIALRKTTVKRVFLKFLNSLNENFDRKHNLVPPKNRALLTRGRCGNLLDVGCGNGEFLKIMQDLGWRVQGVDKSPNAALAARSSYGIEIHHGCLESMCSESDRFDVITMWWFLEHAHDPGLVLDICSRIIKPEGLLIVGVPNFSSFERRVFGGLSLDLPRHLIHFTPQTLTKMLDLHGFSVMNISFDINNMGLRECLRYWLSAKGFSNSIMDSRIMYGLLLLISCASAKLGRSAMMVGQASRKPSIGKGAKPLTQDIFSTGNRKQ